jgi:hypothetical protein
MKWYRDKKWLVGSIVVPVVLAVFGWIYVNSSSRNSQPPHTFSEKQSIKVLPASLGGNNILNLDNIATLRREFYTKFSINLLLDTPAIAFEKHNPEFKIEGTLAINVGKKYTFDMGKNQR